MTITLLTIINNFSEIFIVSESVHYDEISVPLMIISWDESHVVEKLYTCKLVF